MLYEKNSQRKSRKIWALLTLVIVITLILSGCGGTQAKTYTIGVVNLSATLDSTLDGFKASLAEAGYVEGQNVTFLYDGAVASANDLDPIFQGLKEKKVDLIFSIGTAATVQAMKTLEGTDIPVVFGPVVDPVGSGIVADLLKPGGNFTGVQLGNSTPKRLEWLLAMAPNIRRMYVVHNPDDRSSVSALTGLTKAAATFNVELEVREARTPEEISAAFGTIPADVEAIFILPATTITAHADEYVKAANEHKLPLSVPTIPTVKAGALMAFGQDNVPLGRQAGRLAAQILGGAKPADLPVETADYFLAINLQTAKAIGLDIPDEIIRQADTVIR